MKTRALIKAIYSHLPSQKLTNAQLELEYPGWLVEKIYDKTGISERSVAGKSECASDLGVAAAKRLFESKIIKPEQIDFLLFCTQSPDYFLPTSACLIQDKLGLPTTCGALDFNLGCSGFVYGLSLAKGLIETGSASNVLLITADTYSKYINHSDRSVRTIFSDGSSATLISSTHNEQELIGPFNFGTDGKGAQNLIVPAGGQRNPCNINTCKEKEFNDGIFRSEENLYMNGSEIFNFTLNTVPNSVSNLLSKNDLSIDEIDYFVFHQANKFVLDNLRRKLKISKKKFCINLSSYGNTVSSTIPMALELAFKQNVIKKGDRIMLTGFGVGYSWASVIIKCYF